MDSRFETMLHIGEVHDLLLTSISRLLGRMRLHDRSKLQSPEVEAFDRETSILKSLTYGSPEYRECLKRLGPALEHHYAANDHHPEHYPNGISGMSLFALTEMCCDWMAAAKRHADGDVLKSIEINQKRFGYSDELKAILLNTVAELRQEPSDAR